MRFTGVHIENFRAIAQLDLSDLPDVVVIAGPNGCGKSTVLDAIRLVKTVYGGYQENEWHQWMSEFQINHNQSPEGMKRLLRDRHTPGKIKLEVQLAESEREWLRQSATEVTREALWRRVLGPEEVSPHLGGMAVKLREYEKKVERKVKKHAAQLLTELESPRHLAELTITTDGRVTAVLPSLVLETVFSLYIPQHLGVVDYHGPQRNYAREQINGIKLDITTTEQHLRQHALFNYQQKYGNIKAELAASYIRDLVAEKAGVERTERGSLIATLKELFVQFFPGKVFLGAEPQPDGSLAFNVRTIAGAL
jgi:energy-coupling factor transporter ATP-binding protein EcfA2